MKLTTLALALSVLCPAALAQELPAPATQLQKLEPLVGDWLGSGTIKSTPDGGDLAVTATESARWVLGGHYLRQETIVDLGEAIPSIAIMTFTGWDNETQRHVSFQVGNDGSLGSVETLIPDDETILSARIRIGEGQLVVERGVTRLGDGTYRFATQTAIGDGPFFTIVQGTARRTAAAGNALAVEASASMAPPAAEVAVLGKMSGEYRLQTRMTLAPGAPEIEATGTLAVRLIFGGTVQEMHQFLEFGADVPAIESFRYTAWNPADNCYDVIVITSMGGGPYTAQLRQVDDRTFVDGGIIVNAGQPTFVRLVLTCDAQGSITRWDIDTLPRNEDAQRQTARYQKIR